MDANQTKRAVIFGLAAAAAILISTFFSVGGNRAANAPSVILADIFLILLIAIAMMAAVLRSSVRVTLYSYGNIGLVGGIIFVGVFACVFLTFFISSLNTADLSMKHIYRAVLDFPRQFSFGAVFVILFLSVLVGISNIVLIRREGFCLSNALSIIIAGFYIGGTALVYLINYLFDKYVFIPRGLNSDPLFMAVSTVISLFLLIMLCYFECILAGSAIMGWAAARAKPAYDKDYIIILGCSIDKRGGLLPLLKGRVNRAIRFAWEQEIETGKPMKYVPSGGQGPNEIMSEGSAMELYLMTRGAEDYEILPEKRSANTWQNMCFSKEIIDSVQPGAKVAFATTNYHILRSGILARKAGLDAEGIAGDTKWYFWPNGFVREFFGILALNIRAHIFTAAVTAAVCILIGCIGYFGRLI